MTAALENASENSQELLDNSENKLDNSEEIQEMPVPKRGRGRPKGSLDSAPRRRRIIEEPLEPVRAPTPEPTPAPTVVPAEPVRMKTRRAPVRVDAIAPTPMVAPLPAAPPSPRALFRQAAETIYHLQSQKENARRNYWAEQINKTLR